MDKEYECEVVNYIYRLLRELKKEIDCINYWITNPAFGLEEIKIEIKDIECWLNQSQGSLKDIKKNNLRKLINYLPTYLWIKRD